MTKTISKKELYRNLKSVSDDVMNNGAEYTVFQYSQPVFQIIPLVKTAEKKFQRKDLAAFIFRGRTKNGRNLSTTYKKYLYG